MLAEDLIDIIKVKYPTREIIVSVSEDGINGARLEYKFS
jgi:hypothetical protein